MTLILDYASPPSERLNRTPWVLRFARALATLSIIYYILLMFFEPAFQSELHGHDEHAWFGNEVQRRMVELSRRQGAYVPPAPPVPTPTASGTLMVTAIYVARSAALLWAIAFGIGLARAGNDLAKARPMIHFSCVTKLAIVAPLMVLTVVAYARPFLEAGESAALVVVLLEVASIACAWALMMKTPIEITDAQARRVIA